MTFLNNEDGQQGRLTAPQKKAVKNILLLLLLLLIIAGIYDYRDDLSRLIGLLSEGSLDDVVTLIRSFGLWGPLISILLMILQAFIAPIPSFLITGANGVIFGVFGGIIISWLGAMLGAAGTFYLARYLGLAFFRKDQKSAGLMKKVDEISGRYGTQVVLLARLLPFVSFDFISYAAGLSNIKAVNFFIATGLGMIPGTIAYVLLGNQILALSRYSAGITMIVLIAIAMALLIVKLIKISVRKKP